MAKVKPITITPATLETWKKALEGEISVKGDGIDQVLNSVNRLLNPMTMDEIVVGETYRVLMGMNSLVDEIVGMKVRVMKKAEDGPPGQQWTVCHLLEPTQNMSTDSDIALYPQELEEIR